MHTLLPLAERIADRLRARGETIAIAESSTGGLIAAALLAQAGASAFFKGGGVIYTADARTGLLGITAADMRGLRPSTERYALLLAERVRERLQATWGLSETGAAGPTGNRYGDAAGHSCFGLAGPIAQSATLETASPDRVANMRTFGTKALEHLLAHLG